jgi:hypothetical protein
MILMVNAKVNVEKMPMVARAAQVVVLPKRRCRKIR